MPTTYDSKRPDTRAEQAMHQALGLALARWQYVETALYVTAHALIGATHEVSSIVFFQIKSAENKLGLVDKLCYNAVPQRIWANEWKDIRKEAVDAIAVRNGLAHFEISGLRLQIILIQSRHYFRLLCRRIT